MPELKPETVQSIFDIAKDNAEATEMMSNLSGRSCGHCAACCTYLGIQELKKHQGQTCEHLKNGDPNKRCGIYKDRPTQCSAFFCTWRIGLFPDDYRPDMCGMLVTAHPNRKDPETGPEAFVINIFDRARCGQLLHGTKLYEIVQRMLADGERHDISIVDIHAKEVVHIDDTGQIWSGKLMRNPPGDYHGLLFSHDKNLGRADTKPI